MKKSDEDSCSGFKRGWTSDHEECITCKKNSPARYKKCMQAVKKSLKENFSTDEEIEKWKKKKVRNEDEKL